MKQKLFDVETDRSLNFDKYRSTLCKKAGKRFSVLARLSSFMCLTRRRPLIEYQFGYCPLVWMFYIKVNRKD